MKEVYKFIKGYEGYYKISNFGNIRSVDRVVNYINGYSRFYKGSTIKPTVCRGYLYIKLTKRNKRKNFRISCLVYDTFGCTIRDKLVVQVDHIDNCKSNNCINNLQLLSAKENTIKYQKTQHSSSKYVGVSWHKNIKKWQSRIRINGKEIHLGYYKTEYEAHFIYIKEVLKNESTTN